MTISPIAAWVEQQVNLPRTAENIVSSLPSIATSLVQGSGAELIGILWGTLVVGTVDNLIYPMLVGNRLKMHTVPTFISLVGGLIVFRIRTY
jgi:predicted PurR-regulated permease PerM